MTAERSTLDLATVARAVLEGWRTVLVTALVFALLGTGYVLLVPPRYSAEQQVNVTGQISNPLQLSLAGGSLSSKDLVAAQVAIMQSDGVRALVSGELGREAPPVTAGSVNQSTIMGLSVDDATPEDARATLNAYLDKYFAVLADENDRRQDEAQGQLTAELTQYNRRLAGLEPRSEEATTLVDQRDRAQASLDQVRGARAAGQILVNTVGPAYVSPDAVRPRVLRDLVLAVIAGLAIGVAIAVVRLRGVSSGRPGGPSGAVRRSQPDGRPPRDEPPAQQGGAEPEAASEGAGAPETAPRARRGVDAATENLKRNSLDAARLSARWTG